MRAMPPHIDVPGDNAEAIERDGWTLEPHIMRRAGECLGMTSTHAVWRFGFTPGSESANAFGVHTDADVQGFVWVLATRKTGKVKEVFHGFAIHLPERFHEVIES